MALPASEALEWAAVLNVRFWIADPQNGLRNVRSDVLRAVTAAFREQGVQTPHPTYSLKFEPRNRTNGGVPDSGPGTLEDLSSTSRA